MYVNRRTSNVKLVAFILKFIHFIHFCLLEACEKRTFVSHISMFVSPSISICYTLFSRSVKKGQVLLTEKIPPTAYSLLKDKMQSVISVTVKNW